MIVTYKFEDLRAQRDAFMMLMDYLHYGMFDDSLQIGPFSSTEFLKGIWIRGSLASVKEIVTEFESELVSQKYTKTVKDG